MERLENVVSDHLNALDLKISHSYLRDSIQQHPNYPSLISIVDTLDQLGIEFVAGEVSPQDLNEMPYPYLLWSDRMQNPVLSITSKRDLMTQSSFLKNWEGKVLKVNPESQITNHRHKDHYASDRITHALAWAGSAMLFILAGFVVFRSSSATNIYLLLESIVGALIGGYAIYRDTELGKSQPNLLCFTQESDCDSVINSAAATLFGVLKLSDLAFAYFLSGVFLTGLGILAQAPVVVDARVALSVVAPIAMIYSLYHQLVVQKKICTMCMFINLILAFETAYLVYRLLQIENTLPSITALALAAATTLTILIFTTLLHRLLDRMTLQADDLQTALRVKLSPSTFTTFLNLNNKANDDLFSYDIRLTKPGGKHRLIFVTNLKCGPCSDFHAKLHSVIDSAPNDLEIIIRVVPLTNDPAPEYLVSYWLNNIYNQPDEDKQTTELFEEWYRTTNLDEFRKKYPSNSPEHPATKSLLQQVDHWFQASSFMSTPTVLLNGRKLPQNYSISEVIQVLSLMEKDDKQLKNYE